MQLSSPQIVRDPDQLRRILRAWRGAGTTVALAPLMNGLHAGHLALIERAKRHAERVVVSVFGDTDMARATVLGRAACDLIYAPPPLRGRTQVTVDAAGLGDQAALNAMTTSVAQLLNQVQPDVAVFGEKDWQQLVTVRQMVRDLAMPVGIVSAATVREADGLAISTRNASLSEADRTVAATLHKALAASADLIAQGGTIEQVTAACGRFLSESGFASVAYVAARRAHDLAPITAFDPATPARLLAAVQLGGVRLTDNVPIARTTSQN